jgi:hypothetical protein
VTRHICRFCVCYYLLLSISLTQHVGRGRLDQTRLAPRLYEAHVTRHMFACCCFLMLSNRRITFEHFIRHSLFVCVCSQVSAKKGTLLRSIILTRHTLYVHICLQRITRQGTLSRSIILTVLFCACLSAANRKERRTISLFMSVCSESQGKAYYHVRSFSLVTRQTLFVRVCLQQSARKGTPARWRSFT